MAKRFGRNQKREAREEIARLRRELDLTITGGFARATGKRPALDPYIGVPISIDIHDSEDGFTIQRTANIRFILSDQESMKGLTHHLAYSGLVEWRGIVWAPGRFLPTSRSDTWQDQIIELELRALGDRDDRRPLTSPFRPAYDRRASSGIVEFISKQIAGMPA